MNMKQKFYQKTWFKNTILITIPTIISTIGVIISLNNNIPKNVKTALMILIVLLMFILLFAVIFFSGQDDKIYGEYEKLNKEIEKIKVVTAHFENEYKTSCSIITTFSMLFEDWSKNIYNFATQVLEKKSISDIAWDKIKYYDTVCLQCKNMILSYCNIIDISKISVGLILCSEDENGEKYIEMVSHSDPQSVRPSAYKHKERLIDSKYHYAQLIKEEYSGIEAVVNNDEILRTLNKTNIHTDLSKYTQYIAIPIYCTNNKLLGIFQVDTKYNCIIEQDRSELIEFANKKIIPFTNLIVLIDKINKGLYILPDKA